jgi:hypothetical protein
MKVSWMNSEFIILNDEDENGKVPGVRSQENREGVDFVFPDT